MPTIVIRDKQTGQEFEGPTGTPFDTSRFTLVNETPEERAPGPGENLVMGDLRRHVEGTYSPDAEPFSLQKMGANLLRVGGPMAAGAATGGLGAIPSALALAGAGGASELGAEAIEGSPLSPLKAGLAALLPGGTRTGRAVVEAVRGGVPRMRGALAAGGQEPIANSRPLTEAADTITRRMGSPPTSKAAVGLAQNVQNRPQPMNLQGVEDVRRAMGDRVSSGVKSGRPEARQLYGASKEVMEGHGSPMSEQLLEGIGAEGARKALFANPTIRELLISLAPAGTGYGVTGGDMRSLLLGLLPLLQRLNKATGAVKPAPAYDAAFGSGLSAGLQGEP